MSKIKVQFSSLQNASNDLEETASKYEDTMQAVQDVINSHKLQGSNYGSVRSSLNRIYRIMSTHQGHINNLKSSLDNVRSIYQNSEDSILLEVQLGSTGRSSMENGLRRYLFDNIKEEIATIDPRWFITPFGLIDTLARAIDYNVNYESHTARSIFTMEDGSSWQNGKQDLTYKQSGLNFDKKYSETDSEYDHGIYSVKKTNSTNEEKLSGLPGFSLLESFHGKMDDDSKEFFKNYNSPHHKYQELFNFGSEDSNNDDSDDDKVDTKFEYEGIKYTKSTECSNWEGDIHGEREGSGIIPALSGDAKVSLLDRSASAEASFFGVEKGEDSTTLNIAKASAEAKLSVAHGEISGTAAYNDYAKVTGEAQGDLGYADAKVNAECSYSTNGKLNLNLGGEALVAAARGEASVTIDFLLFEYTFKAEGYAGGAGVKFDAGIKNNKFVLDAGIEAGVGGSLGMEVGVNPAVVEQLDTAAQDIRKGTENVAKKVDDTLDNMANKATDTIKNAHETLKQITSWIG